MRRLIWEALALIWEMFGLILQVSGLFRRVSNLVCLGTTARPCTCPCQVHADLDGSGRVRADSVLLLALSTTVFKGERAAGLLSTLHAPSSTIYRPPDHLRRLRALSLTPDHRRPPLAEWAAAVRV